MRGGIKMAVRSITQKPKGILFQPIKTEAGIYYVIVGKENDWYKIEQLSGNWRTMPPEMQIHESTRFVFADEARHLYKERLNQILRKYGQINK